MIMTKKGKYEEDCRVCGKPYKNALAHAQGAHKMKKKDYDKLPPFSKKKEVKKEEAPQKSENTESTPKATGGNDMTEKKSEKKGNEKKKVWKFRSKNGIKIRDWSKETDDNLILEVPRGGHVVEYDGKITKQIKGAIKDGLIEVVRDIPSDDELDEE
jgi:hypothetical protein